MSPDICPFMVRLKYGTWCAPQHGGHHLIFRYSEVDWYRSWPASTCRLLILIPKYNVPQSKLDTYCNTKECLELALGLRAA